MPTPTLTPTPTVPPSGTRVATFLSYREPPASGEAFKRLSFRERVFGYCTGQSNSDAPRNPFPTMLIFLYLLKGAVYVGLYLGLVRDPSLSVWNELNVKRFILYNVITDAVGMNATNGPLGFRSVSWACFVPLYNFLTPETITAPLLPGIPALRSRWLVVGYLCYLALLLRALLAPTVGAAEVLPPVDLLAAMIPFDFLIAEASRCEHYGYMLFTLAFPDRQWLFGLQCVQIGLWAGAGVAKIGPWFKYVVVNMSCNSPLAPFVPIFLKALHIDFPTDTNPSLLARAMATFGICAEISMGFLCAFGPTRLLGVVLTLGFHSFIFLHLPFASVQEWNICCMWASVTLFGMNEFVIPPTVHPALAAMLIVTLLIIPTVGQLLPSRVPFLFAFRPYAGNWFFAWHMCAPGGAPNSPRSRWQHRH